MCTIENNEKLQNKIKETIKMVHIKRFKFGEFKLTYKGLNTIGVLSSKIAMSLTGNSLLLAPLYFGCMTSLLL